MIAPRVWIPVPACNDHGLGRDDEGSSLITFDPDLQTPERGSGKHWADPIGGAMPPADSPLVRTPVIGAFQPLSTTSSR